MLIQKVKKIFSFLFTALCTIGFISAGFAQGTLEHFDPVNTTGNSCPIWIKVAEINGITLENGDEIGVFDDTLCVGAYKVDAFPLTLSAWLKVEIFDIIRPGATSGNTMYFRIWDSETDNEVFADPVYTVDNIGGNFGDPLTKIDTLSAVVTTISIQASPSGWGLPYYVNGNQYTTPKVFFMNIDSTYTLSVDSMPAIAGLPAGERFRFGSWSTGATDSTINYTVPSSPVSITANFLTQYFLTTAEDPDAGGNISPAPPGAWYDSGTGASVSAAALSGYQFTSWSGDLSGMTTPTTLPMDGPKSVTAHFTRVYSITIQTNPLNKIFNADGSPYTTTQTFVWLEGSVHTISVTSPQAGAVGTRYVYASWSDGGVMSHSYTVHGTNETITANFTIQHLLTVTTDHGTASGGGWYNQGASATFSISSTIVEGVSGTRYVFAGWTGTGSGSYTGPDSMHTVTMNNPITETAIGTAGWQTQYKLTINDGVGSSTGDGWYNAGVVATFSLDSTLVSGITGVRYLFTTWTSSDPGSYSGTDSSYSVTMNNAIAENASWQTQYLLTTRENPDIGGNITPAPAPPENWYNASTVVPVSATPAGGYQFAGWSGNLVGITNPTNITMDGPKTVFANFGKEVQVRIQAEPSGLEFKIDDVSYTNPQTRTWIENGLHTLTAVSPQNVTPDSQYVFNYWIDSRTSTSTTNTARTYIVPGSIDTVTVHYKTQYRLTVSTAHGTVSGGGWYDAGSSATFSTDSMDVNVIFGTRYWFDGWTGAGSGSYTGSDSAHIITMNNPITETASWQLQHGLLVQTEYGTASGTNWYDAGSSATFSIDSLTVPDTTGMRHAFTGWTGLSEGGSYTGPDSSHTVTMNYPMMETAGWKTQYYLTTHVNPSGAGTFSPTPGAWYDSLSTAAISAAPSAAYLFAGWSGDHYGTNSPDSVIMNRPKDVTANFGNRVLVTVVTVPSGRTFIADGTPYTSVQTFSCIENSSHTLSVSSPQPGGTGTRYNFNSWSWGVDHDTTVTTFIYMVPEDGDTVTVNFTTQHLLTVNSAYGTATGGAWYNAGAVAPFSINPTTISISAGERWFFSGWTGSGAGSYSSTASSYTVTMNNPITETANWNRQFRLTVTSAQGTATGDNWYNQGAFATFSVGPTTIAVETGIRHFFTGWTGTFSGPDSTYTVQMNSVYTETAQWRTQYYLTTVENPNEGGFMTPSPPGSWYDSGTKVPMNAVPASTYEFAGWSGALTGTATPDTVTMNGPKTVTANFGMEVEVLIQTEPSGREFLVNGTPYTSAHTFTWIGTNQYTLSVNSPQSGGTGLRYSFDSWSDGGNQSHIYTVTNEDDTVTVYFERQYLLTATSAHGTVSGGSWYAEGAEATFSVTPLIVSGGPTTRYVFAGWVGSGSGSYTGTDGAHTVTMNNAITETAQWTTQQSLTLNTYVQPTGTGSVAVTPSVLFPNTLVTLIATPAAGYTFDHWAGAVTGTNSTTSFTIQTNSSVTAYFGNLDTIPPVVINPDPGNNAEEVPVNQPIAFQVVDSLYGVNLSTLTVRVLGTTIIQNGEDRTGGRVHYYLIDNGYYVVYSPATPFTALLTVTVVISCADLAQVPNWLSNYSYRFTTGTSRITDLSDFAVPPNGGTIEDTSGIKIIISNLVDTPTDTIQIGILENPPPFPDSLTGVGLAYYFGPPGLTFSPPITIQLPLSASAFVGAGALSLDYIKPYYFSTATGQWEEITPFTVDTVHMVVTFSVTHFSIFSLAASIPGIVVEETEISNYPNPFNPELMPTCINYVLKIGTEVSLKIYDSSGGLVRVLEDDVVRAASIEHRVFWDGRNGEGDIVSNNVYFCVLELGTDQRIVRKIAVLR